MLLQEAQGDKDAGPPCCCGGGFGGLGWRTEQPPHALEPEPSPEQGPHLLQTWEGQGMRRLQRPRLKLAEAVQSLGMAGASVP